MKTERGKVIVLTYEKLRAELARLLKNEPESWSKINCIQAIYLRMEAIKEKALRTSSYAPGSE